MQSLCMAKARNIFVNRRRGLVAKTSGDWFESLLSNACERRRWVSIKIPSGCQWVSATRAKPVTTPFDFVFTKGGRSIFGDAKTTNEKNWSYSKTTPHQLYWLRRIEVSGNIAGYVVNFREQNQTVFFTAGQLSGLRPRQSLKPDDGILIGNNQDINLDLVVTHAVFEKEEHNGPTA